MTDRIIFNPIFTRKSEAGNYTDQQKQDGERKLIILLPPRVDQKENPRQSQQRVTHRLPEPIPSKVLDLPLEVNPPQSHEKVENRASLGEKHLKIPVLNERNHEQKKPNGDEQQSGKRIGGFDQELIVRCGSQELRRCLNAVPKCIDLLHVEHHQGTRSNGDQRVESANHEKCRRRCHLDRTVGGERLMLLHSQIVQHDCTNPNPSISLHDLGKEKERKKTKMERKTFWKQRIERLIYLSLVSDFFGVISSA